MKKFNKSIFFLASLLLIVSCNNEKGIFVSYSDPQIDYSGRIDTTQIEAAELYWSGTSMRINFEGESIQALFKDESGDNYFNVIIDQDSIFIFRPDTIKKYYNLVSELSKGKHTVEVFKRTEWNRGKTAFYGFQIKGDAKVLPKPSPKKRKIEFYGNSITAAYGVEDYSGQDSPDSTFTNNYLSYAAITARHLDAEYYCICRSGIGIMISWFPMIMPEMFDRLIPADPASKWDFSNYTPDIVVINLFQNDSWLVDLPEREVFKTRFGDEAPDERFIINSYQKFVSTIRNIYPDADIICALGNMDATREDSEWPDYIQQAVKTLNDPKIYTFFMPYKNTPGHPKIEEHEEMANSLIQFIADNIDW